MPEDTPNIPPKGSTPDATAPASDPVAQAAPPSTDPAPGKNAAASLAEEALRAAQQAVEKMGAPAGAGGEASTPPRAFVPQSLADSSAPSVAAGLELLADVNLNVKIELGRTRMFVEDVLQLSEGAVVELDKSAGDPVDIYVNDRHVARGEVLILNENFCVRVSEVLASLPAG